MRKPTMWFPNRSDTNRPVQLQKPARSLKFRILKEEAGLYYLCSENKPTKALISCAVTFLFCIFTAYLDKRENAHFLFKKIYFLSLGLRTVGLSLRTKYISSSELKTSKFQLT